MLISTSIEENLENIKKSLSIPKSVDAILREFTINTGIKNIKAFLIYYEGTVNSEFIDHFIIKSIHGMPRDIDVDNIENLISNQLISNNQLKRINDMDKVIEQINYGGCGVFVDTCSICFVADVKGWAMRGVTKPTSESVVRGPQQSFIETLRINTGLVRRILRDEKLICEGFQIGKRSRTPCNLLYIKDIANSDIVDEVIRRLNGIDVDFVFDSGELEQLLEDFTFLTAPQILSTERPDKVASAISEGKVAVMIDGSPYALILPINAFELTHSPEDNYLRFPYTNLIRLMRLFAILTSLLLPGVFIAVTNYHQESIPAHLIFAIESSRERVPFTMLFELIIIEIAFEFIMEASIRIPSSIGSTLGIIGGLIIGQGAVEANLVSPIVIIIVAVTGIGSYANPNYSLSFSFRVLKYGYIFLAAIGGFLGISLGLFIQILVLSNAQSFGIPFLAPIAPKYSSDAVGTLFVKPIWKREDRQKYLHSKNKHMQANISRKWAKGNETVSSPEDDTEVK